ncbi:hypothetical protein LSAT2_008130 [Lamellibrachia satsuma]|nr:hypothetical protein LSAT2_008130 [Lamellibrachia satsuma]
MEPRNQSVTFFAGAVKMTPEVTSMILFLVVVSSALYLATTDANANDSFFEPFTTTAAYGRAFRQREQYNVDKRRGRYVTISFYCNGYDNMPRCQHGGRGPRKMWTRSGRLCVCLCQAGTWTGPECGDAVIPDNYIN